MKNFRKCIVAGACRLGEVLRPVLIKIISREKLRRVKNSMIETALSDNSSEKRRPYEKSVYPFGINLIGYIRSQMGLGEGCRLIAAAIEKAKVPFCVIDTRVGNPYNHSETGFDKRISDKPKYSINIFHINPEQIYHLQLTLPQSTWDSRYNIGIWLWELEEIPPEWEKAFSLFDEIWTPSLFCAEAFRKKSSVPVHVVPYGLKAKADKSITREHFKLPSDKFLYLVMFDTNSTMERKNPIGAIRAYKKAFPKSEAGTGIVIKINNPTDEAVEKIKAELEGYPNVVIIKETLLKIEVYSLISLCDAFVSLHRSEGFGLVIAEAMLLKTPVIATCWSANSEFMTTRTACCVDSELIEIKSDCSMYKAGMHWAEPDIVQAAVFMKLLKNDKGYCDELSANAYNFISDNYSAEKSAQAIWEIIQGLK